MLINAGQVTLMDYFGLKSIGHDFFRDSLYIRSLAARQYCQPGLLI